MRMDRNKKTFRAMNQSTSGGDPPGDMTNICRNELGIKPSGPGVVGQFKDGVIERYEGGKKERRKKLGAGE